MASIEFQALFAAQPRNGLYKGKEFQGSGVRLVKMNQLFSERRIRSQADGYERIELSEKEKQSVLLKKGDLLFSRTSIVADGVGKCSLIVEADEDLAWDSNIIRIRLNTATADPQFYFYYFNSPEGRDTVKRLSSGAAVTTITGTGLSKSAVPFPGLSVQRRIAAVLSAYDDLIENNQRRIKILEEMARSLYREWFVHFRFPGHNKIKMLPSHLGPIPQGWEVKPLESLMANHIGGGWWKDSPHEDHTEPAWVIRGTDIPHARRCQVTDVPYRYHTVSNLRSRCLQAGDILFEVSGGSKGQPVGRSLLVTPQLLSMFGGESVICASFCKRVRPDGAQYGSALLYLSFLEGYESGEIEQFQVQSTGISNFKWTEYIRQTQRVVPAHELRLHFREAVTQLLSQVSNLGLQSTNLQRTRDLLLPRLLSGNLIS